MPRQRLIVGLLLLIWAASLATPVAVMGPSPDNILPGWLILFIGWMGFMVAQFGWFANVLFLMSVLYVGLGGDGVRVRCAFALLLVCLAVDAMFWRVMYGDNGTAPILSFGVGYYLWFAAIFSAAATLIAPMVAAAIRQRFGEPPNR